MTTEGVLLPPHPTTCPPDLSRCPGLKCRSGRVVEFQAKSGKTVPVLMQLSERATDNGGQGRGL